MINTDTWQNVWKDLLETPAAAQQPVVEEPQDDSVLDDIFVGGNSDPYPDFEHEWEWGNPDPDFFPDPDPDSWEPGGAWDLGWDETTTVPVPDDTYDGGYGGEIYNPDEQGSTVPDFDESYILGLGTLGTGTDDEYMIADF